MDCMFWGLAAFVVGIVCALALPGNRLRVWANLLLQAVATTLILKCTIPVLFGAAPLEGAIIWSYPVERVDLLIDSIGAMFLTFSVPMTFLGSIYAVGYLKKDIESGRHVGTHFALLCLVQISYLIVYSVQNAFIFMVGWEFAAIGAWLLVIWNHRDQKIRFAGFNYLVSTHFSLLFLVAAVVVMHGATNSFQFSDFKVFLAEPSTARNITFVLMVTCFGLKSAFFPFHTWLPRAHSAAPAHISALMSGVIHKAGLFGMFKIILMIGKPDLWMGWYLIIFSVASAFMGVLYTISQRDIKRMLGYSSTENVGIAGIGLGTGCIGLSTNQPLLVALGFGGAFLHVINHALFKCLLFYAAGAVYRFTHTIDLEKLGGLWKGMKWTTPLFLLGSLAGAALPPFNGFVSEFVIYSGLLQPSNAVGQGRLVLLFVVAMLALVGGLSVLSATRGFGLIFLGSPRDPHHVHPNEKEHPLMIIPMVVHLIGILLIGAMPFLGIQLISHPTQEFLDLAATSDTTLSTYIPWSLLNMLTTTSASLIAVIAILLTFRFVLLPKCTRKHVTWGCGYTAGNTRMQYTGSSFSDPMVAVFKDLLRFITRQELPEDVFPEKGSYETHCVDSVERKIFSLLDNGEQLAKTGMDRLPESSAFSFAIGLLALILLVSLVSLNQ
ncbi:MAG: proton-conducting transporter membrane subunit [Pirellulales bacterium]